MDCAAASESERSPAEAFRAAVKLLGGQSATSRLIGISQQAISDRLRKGLPCPTKNQASLKLEAKTGISRHELRPDLYGDAPASSSPTADLTRIGGLEIAR